MAYREPERETVEMVSQYELELTDQLYQSAIAATYEALERNRIAGTEHGSYVLNPRFAAGEPPIIRRHLRHPTLRRQLTFLRNSLREQAGGRRVWKIRRAVYWEHLAGATKEILERERRSRMDLQLSSSLDLVAYWKRWGLMRWHLARLWVAPVAHWLLGPGVITEVIAQQPLAHMLRFCTEPTELKLARGA